MSRRWARDSYRFWGLCPKLKLSSVDGMQVAGEPATRDTSGFNAGKQRNHAADTLPLRATLCCARSGLCSAQCR